MPRLPNSRPVDSPRCDPRLPEAALRYRREASPPLTTREALGAINVTAWLYRDKSGIEGVQVNPNVTIGELIGQFGPSESGGGVVPCPAISASAADLQRTSSVPDDVRAGIIRECRGIPTTTAIRGFGNKGERLKRAGDILKTVYGL